MKRILIVAVGFACGCSAPLCALDLQAPAALAGSYSPMCSANTSPGAGGRVWLNASALFDQGQHHVGISVPLGAGAMPADETSIYVDATGRWSTGYYSAHASGDRWDVEFHATDGTTDLVGALSGPF